MDLRLLELRLQNFKGVKEFVFSPQGEDSTIRGDNAKGKTSITDAWLWLLFNKDSRGRADFEIKTLDENNQPYSGLDHGVEALLSVDDKQMRLCKVYREIWKKKRGHSDKTFAGHRTDHYVDGVPTRKKDWDQQLDSLIQEETFRMLTDPAYLPGINWYRRREILQDVCGHVGFQEVVDSDSELQKLPEILGDRSAEGHKKMIAARKKEVNNRLNEIPSRIDEVSKRQSGSPHSAEEIDQKIKEIQDRIDSLRSGADKSQLLKQKSDLEMELSQLRASAWEEFQKENRAVQEQLENYRNLRSQKSSEMSEAQRRSDEAQRVIEEKNKRRDKLREQYYQVAAEKADVGEFCPTCGQRLPDEEIQASREKFNQDKAERLDQIIQEGQRLKEQVENKSSVVEEARLELDRLNSEIEDLDQQIEELSKQELTFEDYASSFADQIKAKQQEIQEIEQKIQQADSEGQADVSGLQQELDQWRQEKSDLQTADKDKERIEQLKAEERQLAEEYEDLEKQTYLLERFNRSKANFLEEKINSRFEVARFKLFNRNLDGGIEECCEIMVNGVPWGSLNSAARINAGLDIIRTVASYYGVHVPVFVDHCESVTNLLHPGMQQIRLVVDENYQTLEVIHG